MITTQHPRLFISGENLKELKEFNTSDERFIHLADNIREQAEHIKTLPPVGFKITGPRMLKNCQEVHHRIRVLSLMCLLSDERSFAIRARNELLHAASYPHWNKDHFLDTAELITAFAIGYDWLYHYLLKEDLEQIREAMIEKGLKVGLEELGNDVWWAQHKYNWNQVCNGALTIGALAIADEEPELCNSVLNASLKHLHIAFRSFGQDGGWEGGPEYWQYTTWFSALLIDALEGVSGDDLNLTKTEGFDQTGLFPIYSAGPTDSYFNFADGEEDYHALPTLFWLGKRFGIDACITENHRLLIKDLSSGSDIDPFHLVWFQPSESIQHTLPENRVFSGIQAAYLRSEWNNPDATFLGFKGGFNQADHAHMDLGSFVMDMNGERWVKDLGRDDYDLPGYFDLSEGGGRWKYFRLNNKSHNTLVLNGDTQRAMAKANILEVHSIDHESSGILDLTEAYKPHARSVIRTFSLIKKGLVRVMDEIIWNGPQKLTQWQVCTDASISVEGNKAILSKMGKLITARILKPEGAVFTCISATQSPPQNPNTGICQLIIIIKEKSDRTQIEVQFLCES